MDLQNGTTRIEVKLLSSGRYTWTITTVFSTDNQEKEVNVKKIKTFDELLRQEFPDYAKRGSGRVAAMDED